MPANHKLSLVSLFHYGSLFPFLSPSTSPSCSHLPLAFPTIAILPDDVPFQLPPSILRQRFAATRLIPRGWSSNAKKSIKRPEVRIYGCISLEQTHWSFGLKDNGWALSSSAFLWQLLPLKSRTIVSADGGVRVIDRCTMKREKLGVFISASIEGLACTARQF